MNRVIFIIGLCYLAGICSSFSQAQENRIKWSQDYKLSWNDFQGKPQASSPNGAISSVGINAPCQLTDNGILEVAVLAYFYKKESWIKQDEKTDDALKHEQGHFDIVEIYARKLRKKIQEHRFKNKNFTKQYHSLYKEITDELSVAQILYDKETNHHRNKLKQGEWDEKISQQLKELEVYNVTHFNVFLK